MKLGVTNHAVERYVDRVKPGLSFHAAKAELLALLSMEPKLSPGPPEWLSEPHSGTEAWAELADGIVAAVKGDSLTTVLTRGGSHPESRQAKKSRKARKRADQRRHNNASRPPKALRGEGKWAERSWA